MQRRLRAIAFWGIAAWMLLSPAAVQVFGAHWGAIRPWRMFHHRGGGICSARFYANGERVDRYAVLGQTRAKAPAAFRRITSEREARAMAGQLCAKLGPDVDLRLELRCADDVRFTTLVDREVDLCP